MGWSLARVIPEPITKEPQNFPPVPQIQWDHDYSSHDYSSPTHEAAYYGREIYFRFSFLSVSEAFAQANIIPTIMMVCFLLCTPRGRIYLSICGAANTALSSPPHPGSGRGCGGCCCFGAVFFRSVGGGRRVLRWRCTTFLMTLLLNLGVNNSP